MEKIESPADAEPTAVAPKKAVKAESKKEFLKLVEGNPGGIFGGRARIEVKPGVSYPASDFEETVAKNLVSRGIMELVSE